MNSDSHRTGLALALAVVVVLGTGGVAASATASAPQLAAPTSATDVDAADGDANAADPSTSNAGGGLAAAAPNHTENGTAIRALHVSTLLPPIDVLVDGDAVATNVSFVGVTDYQAVDAGNATVQVRINETDEVVFDENVTLAENTTYTVLGTASVAENNTTTYAPALVEEDVDAPGEENASVRFLHAISDGPAVTVALQPANETVGENVTFRTASNYTTVPAGNYTLTVAPADAAGLGELVLQRNVSLDGGTAYTAVAFGFLEPRAIPDAFPLIAATTVDRNASDDAAVGENETATDDAATGNGTTTGNATASGTAAVSRTATVDGH